MSGSAGRDDAQGILTIRFEAAATMVGCKPDVRCRRNLRPPRSTSATPGPAGQSHARRLGRGFLGAPEPRDPFASGSRPASGKAASVLRERERRGLEALRPIDDPVDVDARPGRLGSSAAMATATPSASAIEIAGDEAIVGLAHVGSAGPGRARRRRSPGRPDRSPRGPRPCQSRRAASLAAIRPQSRCAAPSSEPRRRQVLGALAGPSWVCSSTSRQTGPAHVRGWFEPHRLRVENRTEASGRRAATPRRQSDLEAGGTHRGIGPASGTASPPSLESASRPSHRAGRSRLERRTRCRSISSILIRQSTSCPDCRPLAVDLQPLHRERKNDVPFREMVQTPATEQLREVVDDDQVGVKLAADRRCTNGSQGSTRTIPSIPRSETLPIPAIAWKAGHGRAIVRRRPTGP